MNRRHFITGSILSPFAALFAKWTPKPVPDIPMRHYSVDIPFNAADLYGHGISPELIAMQHELVECDNRMYWWGEDAVYGIRYSQVSDPEQWDNLSRSVSLP